MSVNNGCNIKRSFDHSVRCWDAAPLTSCLVRTVVCYLEVCVACYSYRAALRLVLVDGTDDVVRVAEILQKDLVELTLLLCLQRALLRHKTHNVSHMARHTKCVCVTSGLDCCCEMPPTYKVREESLSQQVEVLHSADSDREETLAVCDWLRGHAQRQQRQQEQHWETQDRAAKRETGETLLAAVVKVINQTLRRAFFQATVNHQWEGGVTITGHVLTSVHGYSAGSVRRLVAMDVVWPALVCIVFPAESFEVL